MVNETCGGCIRFVQHYVLGEKCFIRVPCGHCACPRLKHRKPDAKACEHFEAGIRDSCDRFVSKAYLTKALLNCILERDLLPDIQDALLKPCVQKDK